METDKYLFVVEGTGALPVKTVMRKALEILKEKAKNVNDILSEII